MFHILVYFQLHSNFSLFSFVWKMKVCKVIFPCSLASGFPVWFDQLESLARDCRGRKKEAFFFFFLIFFFSGVLGGSIGSMGKWLWAPGATLGEKVTSILVGVAAKISAIHVPGFLLSTSQNNHCIDASTSSEGLVPVFRPGIERSFWFPSNIPSPCYSFTIFPLLVLLLLPF